MVIVCVQEAQTRLIIGRGMERGGLYYLEETIQKGKTVLAHGSADRKIWTWHQRLRHPSIGYLGKLFPSFARLKSNFTFEIYILVKSHKNSYFISLNKFILPFVLIHFDVWGHAPKQEHMISLIMF